jgi:Icc protein
MGTLAHFSDLHLGASAAHQQAVARAVATVVDQRIDDVVVTGDITHSGIREEYALFSTLFAPLRRQGRLTVVPGNHDRCGDDVTGALSDGQRVGVHRRPGLYLVRVDSTATHNELSWRSHGDLCAQTLEIIDDALAAAPRGALVTILVHHHVVRLPVETIGEWFADKFGWPHASELQLGTELLRRARGRCDLLLHGHRHVPRHFEVDPDSRRPLRIFNAGSTAELSAFRVFEHSAGALVAAPRWVHAGLSPRPSPHTRPAPAMHLQLA